MGAYAKSKGTVYLVFVLVALVMFTAHSAVMMMFRAGATPSHLVREVAQSKAVDTSLDLTIDSSSVGPFGGVLQHVGAMNTMSIVFPCSGEGMLAVQTVERFCERTPEELLKEIIVVDDGSRTPLAETFAQDSRRLDLSPRCKLRILRHERTSGLMAAKHTGGMAATGDIVAFFDCHCAPGVGWHTQIVDLISENPRRMVVPLITDLDLDTFDEATTTNVNAKCYLTFSADFKWYDDDSDYIPTISGGLVVMSREWFNMTGGFDEGMHGWGGENLDQSLRAWLCGGEIVRARNSRVAHMWRSGGARTRARYGPSGFGPTNNRGRVAAAWFGAFLPFYRGSSVEASEVANFRPVKRRLGCKPFSFFLYRFRKIYVDAGILAEQVFHLRDAVTGLCLTASSVLTLATCAEGSRGQSFQLGNLDVGLHRCCSGIRLVGKDDCFDHVDSAGVHFYACDVSGNNRNQRWTLRDDGRIVHKDETCLASTNTGNGPKLVEGSCATEGDGGVFSKIYAHTTKEWDVYQMEVATNEYREKLVGLPDG